MKAILFEKPGNIEQLTIGVVKQPKPGLDEVLIEVVTAGINRADLVQRRGKYPPPPGASNILGLEVAGRVVELGPQSISKNRKFKVGTNVMALLTGGGYAEYAVASASLCFEIPKTMTFIEAAAIPEAYFTVWSNVFELGRLKKGESFLVHGGSSGVGSTAIQLAHYFDAVVFTTARSKDKCDVCQTIGADRAICYQDEDFVEVIKKESAGRGVDVILDWIGGDYFERNLSILARNGRLVHISAMHGTEVSLNLLQVMQRNLSITGSVLRSRPISEKEKMAEKIEKHLLPLLAKGKIKPLIAKCFSYTDVKQAHQMMEESAHIGKIVLTFKSEIKS